MTRPLLILAALTLCWCFSSLHAFGIRSCSCIQTRSSPVKINVIKDVSVIPVSGSCRWTQIIVTRKNGSKVCINPNAKWVNDMLKNLIKAANETSRPDGELPPVSTKN